MKKQLFLKRGGDLRDYSAPQLELLEITAEQGFVGSLPDDDDWGDGSLKDEWNDLGTI